MSPTDRPLAGAPWLQAPESRKVLEVLTAAGRPARFVGGCVRDSLLDPSLDNPDLDVATAEPPERVQAMLERAGIRVIPTGLAHGTVTAHLGRHSYEITTLRRDVATDGRHAEVAFTDDFDADAARRDFTINAMSCDGDGRLFDPYGGRADLFAGRIRFVGEPMTRIAEDYLRILRFFRFFARFGRPPAEAAALEACRRSRGGLDRLSGERIRTELAKLLVQPGVGQALALMAESGVLAALLGTAGDRPRLARLVALAPAADWLLRLAALLRGHADIGALADRLRLSRKEAARLLALSADPLPSLGLDAAAHRRAAYRAGPAHYADLLRLAAAEDGESGHRLEAALGAVEAFAFPRFPLSGHDLLAHGVAPGSELGRILRALEEWWVEADFRPDRAACLEELERRIVLGDAPRGLSSEASMRK